MSKIHDKPNGKKCADDNLCQDCQNVVRYVGFVKEFGIIEAQKMISEIEKNRKKLTKQLQD